ncbi:glycosyltransferase [Winogradskyella sediminis]|uniref:glycosyltransferase n=1 Tax=Winogradskyella sediminis TaxID=1382466 RepID=UPI003AA7CECE
METVNQIIRYIINSFEVIILIYFAVSSVYVLLFALAGHGYKRRKVLTNQNINSMAVFIPAYKEDAVIVSVAKTALEQHYPSANFDVIVIADSLQAETLTNLKKLPIKLVEVDFENSTKAKALNAAINSLSENYDYAIILDADNIMEAEFLNKMNNAFNHGFQVVQAHRKAKNLNTSFAILDAASEEINNHIFRKGHSALGLSSGLIGSGMGFEYRLFQSIMKTVTAVGGFDKELEFELAKNNITIEYLQDTVVLDEKIQRSSDFSNQRRRWLATQFIYFKRNYKLGFKALFNGNMNFFDKVFQMMVPPRILLLGVTTIITLIYILIDFGFKVNTFISSYYWIITYALLIATFVLALPKSFYNANTLKAMASMPSAFFRMFRLLFNLKGANSKFIHTSHGVTKN